MGTHDEDTLTVFSDYVCPFCYLGKAAVEEYLSNTTDPPAVEWHVFDLRGYKRAPDGSIRKDVDDGKDDDYFAEVRENVARLRTEYGVDMTLDFATDVDSWDAQAVSLHVKQSYDEETFLAFHDRTFDALWQDGRDVGDLDVLVDVAESAGVDGAEVKSALEDEHLERELKRRFDHAKQQGITGIPTFVYRDHVARGAIPPAQIRRLVEGT